VESVAVANLARLAENHQNVTQTLQVLDEIETIQSDRSIIEEAERDYVSTRNPADLTGIGAASNPGGIAAHFSQLRQSTAGDATQQQRLDELEPLFNEELLKAHQIVGLAQQGDLAAAQRILADSAEMQGSQRELELISQMRADEAGDLAAFTADEADE